MRSTRAWATRLTGAAGYLVKSARPEDLVDAARRTAAGLPVFSAGLAALVPGEMSRAARRPQVPGTPKLTGEVEVLRLVAKGPVRQGRRGADRRLTAHRPEPRPQRPGQAAAANRVELARYAVREVPAAADPRYPDQR